jgi:hypothetical protein
MLQLLVVQVGYAYLGFSVSYEVFLYPLGKLSVTLLGACQYFRTMFEVVGHERANKNI